MANKREQKLPKVREPLARYGPGEAEPRRQHLREPEPAGSSASA